MQQLPVETLIKIFRTACTDGGYTGCSLSQTSRAVRAASVPIRFYSLALSIGRERLDSFLNLYQKLWRESGARPKVIHLHLEKEHEDDDSEDPDQDADEPPDVVDSNDLRSYIRAVRLLHLVADDLVSLVLPPVLMSSLPFYNMQLSDRPFTSLRALIANVSFEARTSVLGTAAVSPLFPALTHVHMVMAPRSSSLPPFSSWTAHAPRVTHLRISFCPLHYQATEEMHLLLGTPTYPKRVRGNPMPPPAARSWPSVRNIALQPVPYPLVPYDPRLYGEMMVMHFTGRDELAWMVKWANKEKIFDSARVLEPMRPKPSRTKRSSSEWRAAVSEAWEAMVTGGVDGDWLTLGEEDAKKDH